MEQKPIWRSRRKPAAIDFDKPADQQTPETQATLLKPLPTVIQANMQKRKDAAAMQKHEPAAGPREFVPSPQQADFFKWIETGHGNAVVQAVAGAGKTTTFIHALEHMHGSIFLGAYNKSAADDIIAKVEKERNNQRMLAEDRGEVYVDRIPNARISTMHSAGFGCFRRAFPKVKVDDRKVRKIIDEVMSEADPVTALKLKQCQSFITKMVSFGKQFLIGCKGKPMAVNDQVWLKIADHFSVDQDLPEAIELKDAINWTIEVFIRSHKLCETVIDFDDMIYGPIAYDLRFFQNDWVLIDESQDSNPARRELAKRMMKPNGRAAFVGDKYQAIYGWAGAGGDSIDRIIEEFKPTLLPLTVTYRCPKSVVSYVRQWDYDIHPHPDAPEGEVRPVKYVATKPCLECSGIGVKATLVAENPAVMAYPKCLTCKGTKIVPNDPWYKQDAPDNTDVILCRYTAPLIKTAYSMIKDGVACKVEGRDIGRGLVALARMWKVSTISCLEERLAKYLDRELEKARQKDSERRAQEIEDKVGTLRIFIERCKLQAKHSIDDLVAEIESLFADNITGVVTLCTGHKSKGREWPRVYWIQTAQRRQPNKEWEAIEERNIKIVCGTRAQQALVLVPETLT